ncbi:hypothetical protein [Nannocystis pusilla]|uniref:Minor tail protein n=1 Tax=Nannocystis pusilla TaxID=889268 RepID=A0ABS7U3Y3_9BACT|nr:hypothetical protein [Nannocystis pusilla]MBZ5715273.1 hypothetical protein [Nannocystis pusilla]
MPLGPFSIVIDDNGQQRLVPAQVGGGGQGSGPAASNATAKIPPLGIQTIAGTGGQVQSAKNRNLLVILQLTGDGNVILPPLGQADVGARITFVRDLGDGVPTIVTSAATDDVNEVQNAVFAPYPMRSLQDSVTYLRVPNGWQREQGTPARPIIATSVTPIVVPAAQEGTQYVVSQVAGPATLELPSSAAVAALRDGFRIVIRNAGDTHLLVQSAYQFDAINGVLDTANNPYLVPPGSVAILEAAHKNPSTAAVVWLAVQQNEDPAPIISASNTVDVPAWRGFGRQVVTASDPAATVNLPPLADLAIGANVLVEAAGGGGSLVTIVPDPADNINGLNNRLLTANRAALLVSDGTQWVTTDGAWFSLPPQVSASNPLSVIQWIDSPKFVTSTAAGAGHAINLPSAALLSYGAWCVIHNNSADAASIVADGSDTINTAASVSVAAGDSAAVYRVTAGSWFAVGV